MAAPVLSLDFGIDNIFTFNELPNTTGSLAFTELTKHADLQDDNLNLKDPPFTVTTVFSPLPPNLPGSMVTEVTGSNDWVGNKFLGDAVFTFKIIDSDIDFLRQGQIATENVSVTLTNSIGEIVTQNFVVNVTGANDTPTAKPDLRTISENTTVLKQGVLGNDTDPDLGDTKAILSSKVLGAFSATNPYLTGAMVKAVNVNFAGNLAGLKDAIQVTFDKAFQSLASGESTFILVKYTMVDGFGATSTSQLRVNVVGSNDTNLFGTSHNDLFLYGEKNLDKIFALAGNDIVFPRGGNDTITLGAGNDTVVFDTAPSSSANKDLITDFNHVADTIRLSHKIFTKLPVGLLKAANFHVGAHAGDPNDYIVYNNVTGALYYDSNGNGAGHEVQFATLGTVVHPVIANNDFVVVA